MREHGLGRVVAAGRPEATPNMEGPSSGWTGDFCPSSLAELSLPCAAGDVVLILICKLETWFFPGILAVAGSPRRAIAAAWWSSPMIRTPAIRSEPHRAWGPGWAAVVLNGWSPFLRPPFGVGPSPC